MSKRLAVGEKDVNLMTTLCQRQTKCDDTCQATPTSKSFVFCTFVAMKAEGEIGAARVENGTSAKVLRMIMPTYSFQRVYQSEIGKVSG